MNTEYQTGYNDALKDVMRVLQDYPETVIKLVREEIRDLYRQKKPETKTKCISL